METEKSCYNCKYFHQHYVFMSIGIRPVACGHCSGRKIKVKELSNFPFKEGCELWEDNKINIEKRKARYKSRLMQMAKDIRDIALILKEEELNGSE